MNLVTAYRRQEQLNGSVICLAEAQRTEDPREEALLLAAAQILERRAAEARLP